MSKKSFTLIEHERAKRVRRNEGFTLIEHERAKRVRRNEGFTLIELLVVIALIALLVTIVIVALDQAQARARDSERRAEVDSIRKALAFYYTEKGRYPTSTPTDWIKLEDATTSAPIYQALQEWLPQMPKDPLYGQNKDGDPAKPYSYQYKTDDDASEYKIHVEMEERYLRYL